MDSIYWTQFSKPDLTLGFGFGFSKPILGVAKRFWILISFWGAVGTFLYVLLGFPGI